MSQIVIGVKNPKKPTAKRVGHHVKKEESIHSQGSATSYHEVNLQDSDSIIVKRLKFWQLVQWFMLVSVFVISVTSLLVSVYIITQQGQGILARDIQELKATTDDSIGTLAENTAQLIQEMNKSLSELKAALEQSYTFYESHYQQLNSTVFSAVELKAALEQSYTFYESRYQQLNSTVFSAVKLAAVELVGTIIPSNELDLTAGCLWDIVSTCTINHNNAGTPPTSLTCETPEHTLEEDSFRNINIYCSVDNSVGEVNPITSTLNIYNGEVSCLCSLVVLVAPTGSPSCRLTIQRCPDTVSLNTTSTW